MLADLNEMTAPYFEVRVGPPYATSDQLVLLPPYLHKLIHVFEYREVVDGGKESASQVRILVYEDKNQSGSVLDLTFDNQAGVKSLTKEEVRQGRVLADKIREEEEILANISFADQKKKEAQAKRVVELRKEQAELASQARFVFQERNTIEVTWGYRNTGKHVDLSPRTARGEILQIRQRFSNADIPVTEVLAVDQGLGEMSKIYPQDAVNFTVGKVRQLLKDKVIPDSAQPGSSIDEDKRKDTAPARVDHLLQALTYGGFLKNIDLRLYLTPEELNLDIQDERSGRVWGLGTNLHGFISELAEKLFAHYYITTEGKNNTTVINFVSRRKFESEAAFHFMWKVGQSDRGIETKNKQTVYNTVKSVDLALYPQGGSGASSSGICGITKKPTGHIAGASVIFSPRHGELKELREQLKRENKKIKAQQMQASDPKNAEVNNSTGLSTYKENCGSNDHEASVDRLAGRMERSLKLSFQTIGIPLLTPGTIKMSNIGLRYSGIYYMLSVHHKITPQEGYICNCVGESNSVTTGGTSVEGPPVRTDLAGNVKLQLRSDPGEVRKGLQPLFKKATKK